MQILLLIFELILFIWFLGCITTYKLGKYTLVDGMGIKSAEFIMLLLYGSSLLLSLIFPNLGQLVLLFILLFWLIIQFFCHWYFTIFGASNLKIKGYNDCFRNTIHIVPANEKMIIPDFYHIVLHTLILINIILTVVYLL